MLVEIEVGVSPVNDNGAQKAGPSRENPSKKQQGPSLTPIAVRTTGPGGSARHVSCRFALSHRVDATPPTPRTEHRTYSNNRNVYIFPSCALACCVATAPGAKNPYSPGPRFGRITVHILGAIFFPSKGTKSRVAPPEA